MKPTKFITCCPDDTYYIWQVHLWLESLEKLNLNNETTVLVFTPKTREFNEKWKELTSLYSKVEFVFIKDELEKILVLKYMIPLSNFISNPL